MHIDANWSMVLLTAALVLATIASVVLAAFVIARSMRHASNKASFDAGQSLVENRNQTEKIGEMSDALSAFTESTRAEHSKLHGRIDETNKGLGDLRERVGRWEGPGQR